MANNKEEIAAMKKKPALNGLDKAGGVIREIREEYNLSQIDLATRLGWDPSQLNRIESGRVPVTRRTIHEVARSLEIQPERLLLKCLQVEYPSLQTSKVGTLLNEVIGHLVEQDSPFKTAIPRKRR